MVFQYKNFLRSSVRCTLEYIDSYMYAMNRDHDLRNQHISYSDSLFKSIDLDNQRVLFEQGG